MKPLFIDIETYKNNSESCRARIAETIKHPAQIKKADTISAWEQNDKPQAIEDALEKTVFNGGLGHIVQIQYSFGDDETKILIAEGVEDETKIIESFFDAVRDKEMISCAVGHNLINFDLRFIKHRAIVLGLQLPNFLKRCIEAKPWDGLVFDTMLEWAGYRDTVSMDNLCYYLSIQTPKTEITGATFGKFWEEKKFAEIKKYGRDEITALKAVYNRLK